MTQPLRILLAVVAGVVLTVGGWGAMIGMRTMDFGGEYRREREAAQREADELHQRATLTTEYARRMVRGDDPTGRELAEIRAALERLGKREQERRSEEVRRALEAEKEVRE